jgi:hypothetical protein
MSQWVRCFPLSPIRKVLGSFFQGCVVILSAANWVRFAHRQPAGSELVFSRLGSFFARSILVATVGLIAGCDRGHSPNVVVATTWSVEERAQVEAVFRAMPAGSRSVEWVPLEPGESLARIINRRGGVDLILGAPAWDFESLGQSKQLLSIEPTEVTAWRLVTRPQPGLASFRQGADPRDDSGSFARSRALLRSRGWVKGYETLVREAVGNPLRSDQTAEATPSVEATEAIAMVRSGRNPAGARMLIEALERKGWVVRASETAGSEAVADSLIADLLGAALFDASRELHEAGLALERNGHPVQAEGSLGEVPPWPPASVPRLREGPNGEVLVDTLLEQIAPDPLARAWLRESWLKPRRPIDDVLLSEIAQAADGKLAAEPRFRAWLRGEWTAWTRQLYRRVARLAGGYVPS